MLAQASLFVVWVMSAVCLPNPLRAEALRLQRASTVWSAVDTEKGQAMATMCVTKLNKIATELTLHKPELPISYSYQSDATSFLTKVVDVVSGVPGGTVRRDGRELTEFLIERGHLQSIMASGKVKSAILIRPPRLLKCGKGIDACLSAYQDVYPSLRKVRSGIVINHRSFDRALYDGLEKDIVAVSDAKFLCEEARPDYIDASRDYNLEWHVGTPCPYHDLMGAFRHGMAPFTSEQTIKDLFIVVESIRNSFSAVIKKKIDHS